MNRWVGIAGLVLAGAVTGCGGRTTTQAPMKVTQTPVLPEAVSTLVVPITVPLAQLQADLNARVPRRLWAIDQHQDKCVSGQSVKAFGLKVKVTPDLSCRIVGEVNRGMLSLTGSGRLIDITMPISATISARNVGGLLRETATGAAVVRTTASLGMTRDWVPTAKVAIAYDWTSPPGIDFLGQRISLADRADAKLAGVIANLERQLQHEVGRAALRPRIEQAWRKAFTVIELNGQRPPAWMRVTPLRVGIVSYAISGGVLVLTVAADVRTETFIGHKPAALPPTPLPPQLGAPRDRGLHFSIPVFADYDQLEPVVLRALRKLNARGIVLPGAGRIDARFSKVTIYATVANRIAVGIEAAARPVDRALASRLGQASGVVWLTGEPVHAADSEVISIRDLRIFGRTNSTATDLVIELAASDAFRAELAASLTQDFSKDYTRVLASARNAIRNKRVGDFVLSANVDAVHHDTVRVTGAGLYLPVEVTGEGEVSFSPGGPVPAVLKTR